MVDKDCGCNRNSFGEVMYEDVCSYMFRARNNNMAESVKEWASDGFTFTCTLPEGHLGPHVACNDRECRIAWTTEELILSVCKHG